ncbi:MAG: 23S rRNA pseudouridine(955/2504/2580) synthase [Gammaproteobacteria bacterium]|nr:23S rRNA pseudouridine(955/2504/2580) synthase [Gammaproteobacteria bacterium]|tara:strand:+ start:499 stop:1461 length:963 start_codon:yes stop_codon:yes gene_type:complete
MTQAQSEGIRTGVQLIDVSEHADGQRLDNFLLSRLKGLPKSHLYRLIRKGEVRLNKKRCKPDSRLTAGDIVRVAPLRLSAQAPAAVPGASLVQLLGSSVLYEDDHLLAVNKPAGLAVHAGSGLRIGLIEALRSMAGEGQFRELVHRLDKDTSGCILIAKNGKVLKMLQADLKQKVMAKTYQALVHGVWPKDLHQVDVSLHKHQPHAGERIVTVQADGKASLTRFRLLQSFAGASLVEAMPVTGRTHQIRVHCQYAGHPIIGDSKYTFDRRHDFGAVRHLNLHAASLCFRHPVSGQSLTVAAPLRDEMKSLIDRLDEEKRR